MRANYSGAGPLRRGLREKREDGDYWWWEVAVWPGESDREDAVLGCQAAVVNSLSLHLP